MKLTEIAQEFDNDLNDPDIENHKKAVLYMWGKLYDAWETQYLKQGSVLTPKGREILKPLEQKLIKNQHLWAKYPMCAYYYAVDIIERRFPEGERAIATHANLKTAYENRFNCKI